MTQNKNILTSLVQWLLELQLHRIHARGRFACNHSLKMLSCKVKIIEISTQISRVDGKSLFLRTVKILVSKKNENIGRVYRSSSIHIVNFICGLDHVCLHLATFREIIGQSEWC